MYYFSFCSLTEKEARIAKEKELGIYKEQKVNYTFRISKMKTILNNFAAGSQCFWTRVIIYGLKTQIH